MRPLLQCSLTLGALCLIVGASAPAAQANPIVLGQIDTFESLTTAGWRVGDPNHPLPPVVVAGGPAGASDHFLRLTALGGSGPGSAVGYQAVFVGEDDRLDPVAESEFGEHRGDVGLYGGFADEEGGGDLGVGPALAQ